MTTRTTRTTRKGHGRQEGSVIGLDRMRTAQGRDTKPCCVTTALPLCLSASSAQRAEKSLKLKTVSLAPFLEGERLEGKGNLPQEGRAVCMG